MYGFGFVTKDQSQNCGLNGQGVYHCLEKEKFKRMDLVFSRKIKVRIVIEYDDNYVILMSVMTFPPSWC